MPDFFKTSTKDAERGFTPVENSRLEKQQQPESQHCQHGIASHRLKAAAVSVVRQQVAPWSQQEKKKNRRREEELDDWLTFPVRVVAVGHEAAALMASDACDERGEPPGGRPHSRPMGTGHRAERRCPVGSPKKIFHIFTKKNIKNKNRLLNRTIRN